MGRQGAHFASVRLEPVEMRHAPSIQKLASHPDIGATTRIPVPYPDDGATSWIHALSEHRLRGDEYAFAIISHENILVGVCGFVGIWRERGVAEIGYWTGKPYWGKGVASAAIRLAVDWGFRELPIHLIVANVLSSNRASCRVLEKAGFELKELVQNTEPKWSVKEKLAVYELNKDRWNALHSSGPQNHP